MRYAIIAFLLLFTFSCSKESKSNLTLIALTTNNLSPAQINDTLNARISLHMRDTTFSIFLQVRYVEFTGTSTNYFIDTIFNPDIFDRGEFVWKLRNINVVDSGFESFPIIPGTTKYINLNY